MDQQASDIRSKKFLGRTRLRLLGGMNYGADLTADSKLHGCSIPAVGAVNWRWGSTAICKLLIVLAVVGFCLSANLVRARETTDRPAFENSHVNEDRSSLRDSTKLRKFLDRLRRIPLNADGSQYVMLGGEFRERFERSNRPVFGLVGPSQNAYALQRAFLFADVHYSRYFRAFGELASGTVAGERSPLSATQNDNIDLLQGFGELTVPLHAGKVSLRMGRQEMSYGSSRLVSVRESPNIRRSFDGVRLSWSESGDTRVDAFLTRPVTPQSGAFNDSDDGTQAFWGVYAATAIPDIPTLKVDFYYLGLKRENASFAQGTGLERRHTIGTRLFGKHDDFDWNIEAAYQFGSFAKSDIRAWTVSSDVGYTFVSLKLSPRIGINADVISGDKDLHDHMLGTFNPLFPKLPYFSEANLAAPANLIDMQPNAALTLSPSVQLSVGWNPLWKESEADAFYAPPLKAIDGTTGGSDRFIGQQISSTVGWQISTHLNITGTYVHFTPGRRVRNAGGHSGDFVAAAAQWIF